MNDINPTEDHPSGLTAAQQSFSFRLAAIAATVLADGGAMLDRRLRATPEYIRFAGTFIALGSAIEEENPDWGRLIGNARESYDALAVAAAKLNGDGSNLMADLLPERRAAEYLERVDFVVQGRAHKLSPRKNPLSKATAAEIDATCATLEKGHSISAARMDEIKSAVLLTADVSLAHKHAELVRFHEWQMRARLFRPEQIQSAIEELEAGGDVSDNAHQLRDSMGRLHDAAERGLQDPLQWAMTIGLAEIEPLPPPQVMMVDDLAARKDVGDKVAQHFGLDQPPIFLRHERAALVTAMRSNPLLTLRFSRLVERCFGDEVDVLSELHRPTTGPEIVEADKLSA